MGWVDCRVSSVECIVASIECRVWRTGSARCASLSICSMKYLEEPYAFEQSPAGCDSSNGKYRGAPYTVAELEKIIFFTECFAITYGSSPHRGHTCMHIY